MPVAETNLHGALDGEELERLHLAGLVVQSGLRVWKRLCHVEHSGVSLPDHKRRRRDQDDREYVPAQVRIGVG